MRLTTAFRRALATAAVGAVAVGAMAAPASAEHAPYFGKTCSEDANDVATVGCIIDFVKKCPEGYIVVDTPGPGVAVLCPYGR